MGRGRKTKDTQPAKKRRPAWQRALRWLTFLTDIALVAALMLTGYAGNVSPLAHSAWWGVLPMGFPIVFWIAATLMLLRCSGSGVARQCSHWALWPAEGRH